jgi:hypothetical protein
LLRSFSRFWSSHGVPSPQKSTGLHFSTRKKWVRKGIRFVSLTQFHGREIYTTSFCFSLSLKIFLYSFRDAFSFVCSVENVSAFSKKKRTQKVPARRKNTSLSLLERPFS